MGLIMALGEAWGPGASPRLVTLSVATLPRGALVVTLVSGTVRILYTEEPQGVPVHSLAKTFCWNFLPAEGHPGSSGDPTAESHGSSAFGPILPGVELWPLSSKKLNRGQCGS